MGIRNVSILLAASRRETENEEFTTSTGIQDEEFLRYFNDAQVQIQGAISDVNPVVGQKETNISVVSGQEAYELPSDTFLSTKIDLVEFSTSGNANDYYELQQGYLPERISGSGSNNPSFFIRRGKEILLQPKPQSSASLIRLTYQARVPVLDLRRATVSAVTLDTGARTITSLTVDTSLQIDETELEEEGFITVCDKNGTQNMRDIPITDVDTATGTVTVEPGFVYQSGETIAVGNFLLRGNDSTTHSTLPQVCERFLLGYTNWKILKRDSSNDAAEAGQEVIQLQRSIVSAFSPPDTTVDRVAVLDDQFLMPEDFLF